MNNIKGELSVSMMCVPLDQNKEYLEAFTKDNVEWLHIDIMDGVFAPNFTLGPDYVRYLRQLVDIPFDFHFMVEEPEVRMQWFDIKPTDSVSIHYESTRHLDKCLQYVKNIGAKIMVAINPATPINVIDEILDYLDGVLVMTVNPGFAGQALVKNAHSKVARMRAHLDELGYEHVIIQTDGNMNYKNMKAMHELGSTSFVVGTSSVVTPSVIGVEERIAKSREMIGW